MFAVAMLAFGHAHRPLHSAPVFDAVAWTLPDGTAPELCLTKSGSAGDPAGLGHETRCEACVLAQGAAPPAEPADPAVLRFAHEVDWAFVTVAPRDPAVTRGGPARAPPHLLDVIA